MLNYPSPHNDSNVLTNNAYATQILASAGAVRPKQGDSMSMVIWNLHGIKGPVIEGQKGPRVLPLDLSRRKYSRSKVSSFTRRIGSSIMSNDLAVACQPFKFISVGSTTASSSLCSQSWMRKITIGPSLSATVPSLNPGKTASTTTEASSWCSSTIATSAGETTWVIPRSSTRSVTEYQNEWRNKTKLDLRPKVTLTFILVTPTSPTASQAEGTLFLRLPHPEIADRVISKEIQVERLDKGKMFVEDVLEGTFDKKPATANLPILPTLLPSEEGAAAGTGRHEKELLGYGRSSDANVHLINELLGTTAKIRVAPRQKGRLFSLESLPSELVELAKRATVEPVDPPVDPTNPPTGYYLGEQNNFPQHAFRVVQSDRGRCGARKAGLQPTVAQATSTRTAQAASIAAGGGEDKRIIVPPRTEGERYQLICLYPHLVDRSTRRPEVHRR